MDRLRWTTVICSGQLCGRRIAKARVNAASERIDVVNKILAELMKLQGVTSL